MSDPVLFVDDEPHVLTSARRQLGRQFDVFTAAGGPEALELLASRPPVAAVVSDMRMPGMSGAELLRIVAQRYPSTTRMILSGQADLESTIAAVNGGHIFRFVTKPVDATTLRRHVQAAVDQHRLITTREELLERTLQGLVETLNDILGLTNPIARERALRVAHYVKAIADALRFAVPWELRLAALLSQVGCVNLPADILDKLYRGRELSADEQRLYHAHPEIAAQLIGRIPQLGPVAEIIAAQQQLDTGTPGDDPAGWNTATMSAVILALATGLDESLAIGYGPAEAVDRLASLRPGLPKPMLDAVRAVHARSGGMAVHYVSRSALTVGMVVDQDVLSDGGDVVLARGDEVTPSHVERLRGAAGREMAAAEQARALRVLIPA